MKTTNIKIPANVASALYLESATLPSKKEVFDLINKLSSVLERDFVNMDSAITDNADKLTKEERNSIIKLYRKLLSSQTEFWSNLKKIQDIYK